MATKVTPRQREIVEFAVRYKKANDGNFPPYQAFDDAGIPRGSAHFAIGSLVTKGVFNRNEYGQIGIVGGEWIPPESLRVDTEAGESGS